MRSVHGRLEQIQILRGAAALGVVLAHAFDLVAFHAPALGAAWIVSCLPRLQNFGAVGVDLFFVISGFVMAHSSSARFGGRAALEFIAERFARISPAYYCLTAVAVLHLVLRGTPPSMSSMWNAVLYVPLDMTVYAFPPLDVGWTLSFEFAFYVMVFGVIWIGAPHRILALLLLTSIGPLVGLVSGVGGSKAWWTNPMFLEFGFGVVCHCLWRKKIFEGRRSLAISIVSIAAVVFCAQLLLWYPGDISEAGLTVTGEASWSRVIWWGIPSALLLVGLINLPAPKVGRDCLLLLGNASYSVYLTHTFVFLIAGKMIAHLPINPDFAILILVSAAAVVGICFHLSLEVPLTRTVRQGAARAIATLNRREVNQS